MDGVVAVGDGIDQRFEDGRHVVLWPVGAPQVLEGGHLHVSRHEPAGTVHLHVQRSGDVGGVQLICPAPSRRPDVRATVGDRLNECVRQPFAGIPGRHEHARDGGTQHPFPIPSGHSQLGQQVIPRVSGP